ncbi:MAG: cation-transporting P-type ATPase [Thermoleophilia bacterium]|nr:cation-transporting P-type ATPase [Thermoleophilia bacterium]
MQPNIHPQRAPAPSQSDVIPVTDAHREAGLTSEQAAAQLVRHGRNELVRRHKHSAWKQVARQLTSPLALLLWLAGALSLVTGAVAFAFVVVLVVAINATFAVLQERQAEHALELLQEFLPPQARVRRDGADLLVDAREVVPGDVLLVAEGGRICADGVVITGSMRVDASALTGESVPTSVVAGDVDRAHASSGTMCVSGTSEIVVELTGMETQIGKIASLTEGVGNDRSPLETQVYRATILIAVVSVVVGIAFVPIGVVSGLTLSGAAIFAIGMLVANVPEGLLPTITLALASGVRSLAKRGALVKRLSAVETLGSTNVICTDKTGTLTENRLRVTRTWLVADARPVMADTGDPETDGRLRDALLVGALCSDADDGADRGDPTELALIRAAAVAGVSLDPSLRDSSRVAVFAFDPSLRRMTTVTEHEGDIRIDTKGAPESLIDLCVAPTSTRDAEAWRRDVMRVVDDGAEQGLRMIALATKTLPIGTYHESSRIDVEQGLTLVALCGLADTLRVQVPDAVAACHLAGIRIVVITGDHGLTARAIAHQAGITAPDARIITGAEVDAMDESALADNLARGDGVVFARSSPETKLRIARALQGLGLVVAMTGDGVNDAPALRQADIGVAMGRSGTDVARDAAEIILTDDNFASIVAAIGEGRRVYANIRKFVVYVFAHATPEVVPFLVFALSGGNIPLGLTAAQILAIDLGTETLPALALGRERAERDIMRRAPRDRDQNLLTRPMLIRAWLFLGGISALCVFTAYMIVLHRGGWHYGDVTGPGTALHHVYQQATTVTFLGIVMCQIGTALASRTERASLRELGLWTNPLLTWGIAFELAVAALIVYVPPLQSLFNTTPITWFQAALIAPFPFIVWGSDELRRSYRRSRTRRDDLGAAELPQSNKA